MTNRLENAQNLYLEGIRDGQGKRGRHLMQGFLGRAAVCPG